jgi:hypothetical protein
VTGSVTSGATTAAVAGVTVVAYRAEQDACCNEHGVALTDRTGRYSLSLPSGLYRIHFKPAPGLRLAPQWWRNDRFFHGASKLSVDGDVAGIDATLGEGQVVSGSVTYQVNDAPSRGVGVLVYESLGPGADQGLVTHGWTDGAGRYSVTVPAGTFRLNFVPPENAPSVFQWWPAAATFDLASDVTVSGDRSGINIALPPGVTITGRVTDARTGAPLSRANVVAVIGCCDIVGVAYTDSSGAYKLLVQSGTYRMYFYPAPDSGYQIMWWKNAADYNGSAEVLVAEVPVSGIDAALEKQ